MKHAYTVIDIRLVSAHRENDNCRCDGCGEITNYNEMFNVTVESEETRSGIDELIMCTKCTAEMEE